MSLREYCEQTSLHGWYYIATDRRIWKLVWTAIVLTSIGVASLFIYKAAEEFTKSTVVTTIHSTTEPLSDVYFPAVTVCNINQVRKSFFNDLNINNNKTVVDLLYQQFYTGSEHEPTQEEREFMRSLFTSETFVKNEFKYHRITRNGSFDESQLTNWTAYLDQFREYIEKGFQFTRLAVQEPYGVMILKASYGMKNRYSNSTDFNPYFGTDYGICSIIKPQLAFNSDLDGVPYWEKIFGTYNWNVSKGVEVGKANGLSMLLDAETFDYTFHLKAGEGFKIAVHHHLDQPIMSIKEVDISPGSVFQIAVTPTLMSTTPEARDRFSPLERGCYVEGELPLEYLPSKYYRYEMSNCLFEAAYEKILDECNCTPSFHQLAFHMGIRTGPGLTCMNKILRIIGKLNTVGPNKDVCLSACDDQINNVGVTSSKFPNRETFVKREEFCITFVKLNRTCNSEKRTFLVNTFPSVCKNIASVVERAKPARICEHYIWAADRLYGFSSNDTDIAGVEEDIFQYAKKNLAVVNVYIKDPVVTRIMRDQKIPVIAFVANAGGLLGLCMGFSLVSVFEILYHILGALRKWWSQSRVRDGQQRDQSEQCHQANEEPIAFTTCTPSRPTTSSTTTRNIVCRPHHNNGSIGNKPHHLARCNADSHCSMDNFSPCSSYQAPSTPPRTSGKSPCLKNTKQKPVVSNQTHSCERLL